MIKFTVISIKAEKDYDTLRNSIPKHLVNEEVINFLKKNIGLKCDTINIEYPYSDSDYLSTYYDHYAQKFKKYSKDCCRLHFEANDEYYGYITLRPTVNETKIGKTYLAPQLLIKREAYLILGDFYAHTHGQEMLIKCFPWKKQQTDISCCAHTSLWTIIRYFGHKYPNYSDSTIGKIVEKAKSDWGRETPSLGLNPIQVSDVFKEYGFSPIIVSEEKSGDYVFLDEILAYVESGIPMIGFLSPQEHAVSIIGHGKMNYEKLDNPDAIKQLIDPNSGTIPHTRLINSLYVMDDRFFPYSEVPVGLPDKKSDVDYGINQLCYTVVPLYNRMQLTYREVYRRMIVWLKAKVMKWEKLCISRIYITSSNSLKRNAMQSTTMPDDLKDVIISLPLPKFVWCIDLAGIENYKKMLTSGRIIIDTTSATWESEPWIMRHDMEKIQYKDYSEDSEHIYTKKVKMNPYHIYENNLIHI